MKDNLKLAKVWLKRARSSLVQSEIGINNPNIMLEDLCFNAQQATEKSLKSLFAFEGIEIPKTHSIGFIIKKLKEIGYILPENLLEAALLTEYSVKTRYPGEYEEISKEDYKEAVDLAKKVYKYVSEILPAEGLFK